MPRIARGGTTGIAPRITVSTGSSEGVAAPIDVYKADTATGGSTPRAPATGAQHDILDRRREALAEEARVNDVARVARLAERTLRAAQLTAQLEALKRED